jgi:hypothetical protein
LPALPLAKATRRRVTDNVRPERPTEAAAALAGPVSRAASRCERLLEAARKSAGRAATVVSWIARRASSVPARRPSKFKWIQGRGGNHSALEL